MFLSDLGWYGCDAHHVMWSRYTPICCTYMLQIMLTRCLRCLDCAGFTTKGTQWTRRNIRQYQACMPTMLWARVLHFMLCCFAVVSVWMRLFQHLPTSKNGCIIVCAEYKIYRLENLAASVCVCAAAPVGTCAQTCLAATTALFRRLSLELELLLRLRGFRRLNWAATKKQRVFQEPSQSSVHLKYIHPLTY
jgi:hypothetical protein